MELDKSELDDRLFDGFANTSTKRYIFVCNLSTGVSRWSKNAIEYFNLPDEYVLHMEEYWEPLIHQDDRSTFHDEMKEIFDGVKFRHEMDYKVKNKEGVYVAVSCHGVVIPGYDGHASLFMGTIDNHGIMDNIDGITGLYNVYEFHNYVEKVNKPDVRMSVMFVGVGRFSEINDAYGFSFGDHVIKEVSLMMLHLIRPAGKIFKMDGMHFACVFLDKEKKDIEAIYYQIRQMLKNDVTVDEVSLSLLCCAGVIYDCRNYDEYSIRTSGKYALSQSKRDSAGQIVYFDDTLLGDNERNLSLIRELRKSVLSGCEGFYLVYQPIIDAKSEKPTGAEALLRYKSDTMGNVPPGVFIPWLEKDPCFYELGNWILRNSVHEMKGILEKYPDFLLNVNVAYPQFSNSDFKFEVMRILSKEEYPPQNLCLELTERCRQLDRSYLTTEINFLKSRMVKIALDDFGTGFSSLNLLSEFPVDTIKIDRGFVSDITTNRVNQTIVNAITICASDLNIHVCVEGLEDREMIEFIKKYPVYSFQGYYFSKPIPLPEFMEKYAKE